MPRVLAVDLDDTLLRSDGTISPAALGTLIMWRQAGHHVVVATGRPPRAVGKALPPLLQDVPWICYNGAEVRQMGKTVFVDRIPAADVRTILEQAATSVQGYATGVEIDDLLYLNRLQPGRRNVEYVEDILTVAHRDAAKILFFAEARRHLDRGGQDDFSTLRPLLDSLPAGARPMLSTRYNLVQILSSSADKAVALRRLVDEWGLSMDDVVAIGDDVNDVEMVREAGLGVAVGNAVDEVMAVAKRVTASNDEDGVAQMLEELLRASK